MDDVLARAEATGIGVVVARNSNHFGVAGYWARQAVPRQCIGICVTPASKSLAPFGSKAPLFGTNLLGGCETCAGIKPSGQDRAA